jgi:hypothetical protein
MAAAAKRTTGMFDRASGVLGMFGAAAGAAVGVFSAARAVTGTISFLDSVKKITQYTGMSVESAGGLVDVVGSAGIEAGEAERMFSRMALSSSRMQSGMTGYRRGIGSAIGLYRTLGLVGKTPEQQLFRMATLAKQHRLSIQQVQQVYRVAPESARKLMTALERGPEALKKQVAEFKKLGIATEKNVDMVQRIKQSQRKISEGWHNIQMILAVKFLPIIEKALSYVADHVDEWTDKAEKFGRVLANILEKHGSKLIFIGKLMAANFALMKVTGIGLGGLASKVPSLGVRLLRLFGRGALAAGGAGAATMAGGTAMAAGGAGAAAGGGALAAIAAAIPPILVALAAIAVVVGTIYAVVKVWKANVAGVQQVVRAMWSRISAHLTLLWKTIVKFTAPLVNLFKPSGIVGRFFMVALATAMKAAVRLAEGFLFYLRVSIRFAELLFDRLSEPFTSMWESVKKISGYLWDAFMGIMRAIGNAVIQVLDILANIPGLKDVMTTAVDYWRDKMIATANDHQSIIGGALDMWKKARSVVEMETQMEMIRQRAADRAAARKKEVSDRDDKPPAPYNDFRGSRFDITQRFAEGFDPDRIALAFTSDLAALGERKLQSGFSPLYAVR